MVRIPDSPRVSFKPNEKLYLARGPYQGTVGTFVRERSDVKWADIRELNGIVRSHPSEWLQRCPEGELVWHDLLGSASFNTQRNAYPNKSMHAALVEDAKRLGRSE